MKNLIYLILLFIIVSSCNSAAQNGNTVEWSEFEIIGSKKVKTETFGLEQKIDWPVFSQSILKLNQKEIIIEGYYLTMESLSIENLKMEQIFMITIAEKPTITVCGVPQFRQNEFIRLSKNINATTGQKITIKGILKINQDGSNGSILNLDDPKML